MCKIYKSLIAEKTWKYFTTEFTVRRENASKYRLPFNRSWVPPVRSHGVCCFTKPKLLFTCVCACERVFSSSRLSQDGRASREKSAARYSPYSRYTGLTKTWTRTVRIPCVVHGTQQNGKPTDATLARYPSSPRVPRVGRDRLVSPGDASEGADKRQRARRSSSQLLSAGENLSEDTDFMSIYRQRKLKSGNVSSRVPDFKRTVLTIKYWPPSTSSR